MEEKINKNSAENKTDNKKENATEATIKDIIEAVEEMYDDVKKMSKTLMEVILEKRNFSVQLKSEEEKINLKLIRDDGQEKNLSMFLPQGYYFACGEETYFACNHSEKIIEFPEHHSRFRGFLLSLFHEIGHSHKKKKFPITRWDDLRAFGEMIYKRVIKCSIIAIKKEWRQKGAGVKFMNHLKLLPIKTFCPYWYLDKITFFESERERDAWAYSLKQLRGLKRKGYDVFAGYKNAEQIMTHIDHCLFTYDVALLVKKLENGDLRPPNIFFSKRARKNLRIVVVKS